MATRTAADVPLESGDHLTREEFHRRYLANPQIKKAELIDGGVYVPSPVRLRHHGRPHGLVMRWLSHYLGDRLDVTLADNTTIYLDDRSEVQPDAFLWLPEAGGGHETEDGYFEGSPQLIVEVAASSVSYDLYEKKEAFRRNGVPEYVVWRVQDRAIDWFRLVDGQYVRIQPDAEGVVESEQFPGLRLHIPSMLAGDLPALLARMSDPSKA